MANFDHIDFYPNATLEQKIYDNISTYFSYGLLEIGAYYNIAKDQQNYNNIDESTLVPLFTTGIADYTTYKGMKNDWIWETNVQTKDSGLNQPIQISGVYVNDVFYGTGTQVEGTGFYIDYPRGQVIFDNPLPSNYEVELPRSIRWVNTYPADSYEYRKIKYDWYDPPQGSGLDIRDYAYLPAVFIGLKNYKTIKGYQLGSRGRVIQADIQFDVVAGNAWDASRLADLCYNLETRVLTFYDLNTSPKPFLWNGSLNPDSETYPNLVSNYPTRTIARFMENGRYIKLEGSAPPLEHRRITLGLQLDVFTEGD